jgi:hypothetical protein
MYLYKDGFAKPSSPAENQKDPRKHIRVIPLAAQPERGGFREGKSA